MGPEMAGADLLFFFFYLCVLLDFYKLCHFFKFMLYIRQDGCISGAGGPSLSLIFIYFSQLEQGMFCGY